MKLGPVVLREEHRFRVFGNRVMRRKFGRKRGVKIGGWEKTAQ
jgi:hypothetical protein